MKILRCPYCQGAVVINSLSKNLQEVITCIHCGFSDYAYIFNLSKKQFSPHNTPEKLTVADVIQALKQQLDNNDLSYVNIEEFIFDLHRRCNEFSPLLICKLINTLLEYSEIEQNTSKNETLFVKYEPEKVSLHDIYEKMKDFQESFLARTSKENPSCVESSSTDIQKLRKEIQQRQRDIDSWIGEYNLLLEKFQKVTEENETLKFLLQKQI